MQPVESIDDYCQVLCVAHNPQSPSSSSLLLFAASHMHCQLDGISNKVPTKCIWTFRTPSPQFSTVLVATVHLTIDPPLSTARCNYHIVYTFQGISSRSTRGDWDPHVHSNNNCHHLHSCVLSTYLYQSGLSLCTFTSQHLSSALHWPKLFREERKFQCLSQKWRRKMWIRNVSLRKTE